MLTMEVGLLSHTPGRWSGWSLAVWKWWLSCGQAA